MKKIPAAAMSLLLLLACGLAGCLQNAVPSSNTGAPSSPASSPAGSAPAAEASSAAQPPKAESLLQDITAAARLGRVLQCEYAINSVTIDAVEEAWGKADDSQYVASAKGTYYTFTQEHIVFGVNKGMLVFEIRSYEPGLEEISYADVTGAFGEPEYTSETAEDEVVIGYTLGYSGEEGDMAPDEVKIKFVFPGSQATDALEHYMVLDPAQTANLMSGDPGREW